MDVGVLPKMARSDGARGGQYKVLTRNEANVDSETKNHAKSIYLIGTSSRHCSDTDPFNVELRRLGNLANLATNMAIYHCPANLLFYNRHFLPRLPNHLHKLFSTRPRRLLR